MECNKEEAVRAMTIAEKKMEIKDFLAAKRIALKAQQLFPGLENISHMLTVCEVHCAAAMQVNGTVDWYRILQVDATADESVIKKQYRKFALLLHPDKNKFAGAEAAFKLIGEANLTLTDKGKRSLYDLKSTAVRAVATKPQPQAQYPNRNSFVKMQPGVPNNFNNHASVHGGMHQQQKQKEAQTTGSQSFWTVCPFCSMRYQYYRTLLNRNLRCQNCLRNFTAFDLNTQGPFKRMNQNGNQQGNVGFQGDTSGKSTVSEPATNVGTEFGGRSRNKVAKEDTQVDNNPANVDKLKFEKINLKDERKREQIPEFPGDPKAKRRRKTAVQSSDTESSDSEEETVEDANHHAKNVDDSVYQNPRRSTRQKQNITYKENQTDDEDQTSDNDFVSSLKRRRRGGSSCQSDHADKVHLESDVSGNHNGDLRASEREDGREDCSESGTSSKVDIDASEPDDLLSYADTEFYDFQKNRDAIVFASDQIWALYDDSDGMPRFYARIKHVSSPGFKVQYTWLEHDPVGQAEKEWSDKDLPVGCGVFGVGKTQSSEDLPMFSHPMSWENGPSKNTYVLRPKKGEVWALYKDWDIEWKSEPVNHRSYKYEVVEILSDYTQATGVVVARLIKVKSFVSLFARAINEEADILQIPPSGMLKFSHMVPSYKMTGEEREGIPQGSYELDTASLPLNFDIVFPSVSFEQVNVKVEDRNKRKFGPYSETSGVKNHEESIRENLYSKDGDVLQVSGSCEKNQGRSHSSSAETQNNIHVEKEGLNMQEKQENLDSATASSNMSIFKCPDAEFYSFESEKTTDSFQCGQIWALYSDIDGFPSYYAMVTEVEMNAFKVHVSWLEVCPVLAEEIQWCKKNLYLGCGRYKLLLGKKNREIYDTVEVFSHQVKAEAAEKKNHYDIHPNVSEVWAIYRNWSAGWEESDRDRCEYDLVEVISSTASVIKVKILEKVKGYYVVFKQKRDDDGSFVMEFPRSEWMRFSHRVPSFRLTEERGGKLRDCWELDPASVPETLLCTSDS